MDRGYDVFVSYSWADRAAVQPLAQALRERGLRVFVDDPESDFQRITTTITQSLATSCVLLAYYSAAYPTRRACQWELTAAYLTASRQGDPARRILVVNPEREAEHLYPAELRDALFRAAPDPEDAEAAADLAETVACHVNTLTGAFGAIGPLVPPRWVPAQGVGSTRFVGRVVEMWKIHSALHPEATAVTVGRASPGIVQLRGLGGIGKSLLAEEYALRFGPAYPGGVFWLRAYGSRDQDDLTAEEFEARRHDEFRQVAQGLGLGVAGRDPGELAGLLAAAIQERGQSCLWVVDDLPTGLSGAQIRRWFAPHPLARTLVTTRSQTYGAFAMAVEVDVLSRDEAYELLTARRPPLGGEEEEAARGIARELGYHALAVDVAGAALRNQEGLISYAEFHTRLGEPDEDELELISELADALPNGHESSIARTLLRSIDQLDEPGRDVLRLTAVLGAAPVPARLIAEILARADDGLDHSDMSQQAGDGQQTASPWHKSSAWRTGLGLNQAASLSLVAKTSQDQAGVWSVHALVARTVRFREREPARLAALRTAAIAVLTDRLAQVVDPRAHAALRDVVVHARELTRHASDLPEIGLLAWVARYDYERGSFTSARILDEQVLNVRHRLLGEDHPDTLTSKDNLAVTLYTLGDLPAARALHEQVLDARRRVLGKEHPDTLVSMSNLAETLYELRDFPGARVLHEQVLDARRRLLGEEHPDTLTSMGNFAVTLRTLGDLVGARALEEQVLDARRRLFGEEHPDTRLAQANLGEIICAQNGGTGPTWRRGLMRFFRRSAR